MASSSSPPPSSSLSITTAAIVVPATEKSSTSEENTGEACRPHNTTQITSCVPPSGTPATVMASKHSLKAREAMLNAASKSRSVLRQYKINEILLPCFDEDEAREIVRQACLQANYEHNKSAKDREIARLQQEYQRKMADQPRKAQDAVGQFVTAYGDSATTNDEGEVHDWTAAQGWTASEGTIQDWAAAAGGDWPAGEGESLQSWSIQSCGLESIQESSSSSSEEDVESHEDDDWTSEEDSMIWDDYEDYNGQDSDDFESTSDSESDSDSGNDDGDDQQFLSKDESGWATTTTTNINTGLSDTAIEDQKTQHETEQQTSKQNVDYSAGNDSEGDEASSSDDFLRCPNSNTSHTAMCRESGVLASGDAQPSMPVASFLVEGPARLDQKVWNRVVQISADTHWSDLYDAMLRNMKRAQDLPYSRKHRSVEVKNAGWYTVYNVINPSDASVGYKGASQGHGRSTGPSDSCSGSEAAGRASQCPCGTPGCQRRHSSLRMTCTFDDAAVSEGIKGPLSLQ